jgi:hypothetical protein
MAIFNQGILSGFNGRIGNVIGSTWKGRSVMKIRPASVSNPNTERQQQQRSRFGLVGRFIQAHRNVIRIGFRAYTREMTSSNAAMSYNLANAVAGTYPDQYIDFSKVMLSMGTLSSVSELTALSEAAAAVTLNWTPNNQVGNAGDSDQLIASLYDSVSGEVVYFPGCASRLDSTVTLSLPVLWSGRTAEVFVFLVSIVLTSTDRESVSNTMYAGSVEIL